MQPLRLRSRALVVVAPWIVATLASACGDTGVRDCDAGSCGGPAGAKDGGAGDVHRTDGAAGDGAVDASAASDADAGGPPDSAMTFVIDARDAAVLDTRPSVDAANDSAAQPHDAGWGDATSSQGPGLLTVGGYYRWGQLTGYWWTAADSAGSMISPADFALADRICVTGKTSVGGGLDTHGGAVLGYNVNQAPMPPNPPQAVTLSPSGSVRIALSGQVPSDTRLRVSVDGVEYCAPIGVGLNVVTLSQLRKQCWLPGGAAYSGQPVMDLGVHVPSNALTPTSFDYCVTELTYTP